MREIQFLGHISHFLNGKLEKISLAIKLIFSQTQNHYGESCRRVLQLA